MKHFCTLIVLVIALGHVAHGQGEVAMNQPIQPAALPALSTARYSMDDTIRAVRHLFAKRTQGAVGWTHAGVSTLATAAVNTAMRPKRKKRGEWVDKTRDNQDWVAGSLMLGYGLFRMARFGPEQYERVVAAYEQGAPLPTYVSRRLKPKYFRYRPF